jgi:hypothetical protein
MMISDLFVAVCIYLLLESGSLQVLLLHHSSKKKKKQLLCHNSKLSTFSTEELHESNINGAK